MSSPALAAQVPPRAARPQLVTVAFWLFIAATVAALAVSASGIVLVVNGAASHDATALVPGTKTRVVELIPIAVGVLVVIGVIRAVVLVLLALVLRRGRSWVRWALGAVALLLLLGVTDSAGLGGARGRGDRRFRAHLPPHRFALVPVGDRAAPSAPARVLRLLTASAPAG